MKKARTVKPKALALALTGVMLFLAGMCAVTIRRYRRIHLVSGRIEDLFTFGGIKLKSEKHETILSEVLFPAGRPENEEDWRTQARGSLFDSGFSRSGASGYYIRMKMLESDWERGKVAIEQRRESARQLLEELR